MELREDDFAELPTHRVGRRVIVLATTGSTNTEALVRAGEPGADGLVILAEHQTAGRGRLGRSWHSPRGASLLATVLLIEPDGGLPPQRLAMLTGVAVCAAVAECTDVRCELRWPNDVLHDGRKLAGILVETRRMATGQAFAVGLGLNCFQQAGHFPDEFRRTATSLELASEAAVDRRALARQVLVQLDGWLTRRPDDAALKRAWLEWSGMVGQWIRVRSGGRELAGTVLDVDPASGLLLQTGQGPPQSLDPAVTTVLP